MKLCTVRAVISNISPMVGASLVVILVVIDGNVNCSGCPGIETRLPLLFNYGLLKGRITPERFVELTSTAPAKLVNFDPLQFLNSRTDALMFIVWIISSKRCTLAWSFRRRPCHLVIVFFSFTFIQFLITDFGWRTTGILKIKWHLSASPMIIYTMVLTVSQSGSSKRILTKRTDSPYEGMMFNNWPRYTIIRGKIVWAEGRLFGSPKDGEYLKRQASQLTMSAVKSIANDKRRVATWLYDNGK